MYGWSEYVPVAERRRKAKKQMDKLRKKGKNIYPVEIEGRLIAKSFWGKSWCKHLESFSDYSNRLPRGRTYARNGSVCHLAISAGTIKATVSGSELYDITITVNKLLSSKWDLIKKQCAGQIGSLIELLQGNISDAVMKVVTDKVTGLFPSNREIKFDCSCPDGAYMCKHIAAALYGIGNRLDHSPDLLFLLRGVSPEELLPTEIAIPDSKDNANAIDDNLENIFGIELDETELEPIATPTKRPSSLTKKKEKPLTARCITSLRNSLKLSVTEFAKKLSVNPATVYRWESSTKPLNLRKKALDSLQKLERSLKKEK